MDKEQKLQLITRNCQEILVLEELREAVSSGKQLKHYIGFEISGMVHLGTGLMAMGKIADFSRAGIECCVFLADFHSYLNKKLDGTWETIRDISENYFKQALLASLKCFEADMTKITFLSGKDLYEKRFDHWETFMQVGQHLTLSRNLKSVSITGKQMGQDVDMATLFYPPLQVADIFTLDVDIAHSGMDQRKAHVIAREVAHKMKRKAPIALHHNLIAGLTAPEKDFTTDKEEGDVGLKMSKSKPGSAIFVHDSPEEIKDKILKAYGPPKIVEHNPLLNWVKTLVFWGEDNGEFVVTRPEKFGGNLNYKKYSDVEKDYESGELFPLDLKNALAEWLVHKLEPARNYFEQNTEAKKGLEKIIKLVQK